jgi:dTDP-4-dehydrorhamnose 3,5-epimerase
MKDSEIFIIGANGQLGRALRKQYPDAKSADINELDITNRDSVLNFNWSGIKYILNAAAYTDVDGAETPEGRVAAWKVNAQAVGYLAETARKHDIALVHISTDYVFDGTKELHVENEGFSPLGVYGASKAAGDIAAALATKHYIIRSSWVIGDGKNFVRSIYDLGQKGVSPGVVADQFGRPTFTAELVRIIDHLLSTNAPHGTYNGSNGGNVVSWADIARQIYKEAGFDELSVGDTTAEKYFAGKLSSPRPVYSGLDLTKLEATGFKPTDWREDLKEYIRKERENS